MNTTDAVVVLKAFRPKTIIRLSDGSIGEVLCQLRELCTVQVGHVITVVNRWDCEPVAGVEYTPEDLAFFKKPLKEVAL